MVPSVTGALHCRVSGACRIQGLGSRVYCVTGFMFGEAKSKYLFISVCLVVIAIELEAMCGQDSDDSWSVVSGPYGTCPQFFGNPLPSLHAIPPDSFVDLGFWSEVLITSVEMSNSVQLQFRPAQGFTGLKPKPGRRVGKHETHNLMECQVQYGKGWSSL